jgi:hypothetical protein
MAAITDLASASSIAATDYFVVSQSGTDRKALANKMPMLDQAQTFTAAQTFGDEINARPHTSNNAWSIDVANGTTATVPNGSVYQPSSTSVFSGFLLIANATDGGVGLFLLGGGVVVEVADTLGVYSNAVGTATSTNVYWDGSSQYLIKNNTGGSRVYSIFTIRMRAGN